MELDLFCDWFEGKFDNWGQASSNPTKWAHIFVVHERLEERNLNKFKIQLHGYTIQRTDS